MSVLGFVCNQYIGRHSGANLGTIMAVTANTLDFMICFYKSKKKKQKKKSRMPALNIMIKISI